MTALEPKNAMQPTTMTAAVAITGAGAQGDPPASPSNSGAIVVRRASHTDRPAIARFIEQAYGPRADYKAARWNWQLIDNPFARAQGNEIPIWIALDGDRIVGQIAVQMALLDVEGTTLEAGWAADVMVLRSHRGCGLGHRLHDAVASEVDILMALAMAQASRRMAEKQGRITVGSVQQLTRWVHLEPASVRRYLLLRTAHHRFAHRVARYACSPLQVHRAFPVIVNPVLRLRDRAVRRAGTPNHTDIVEVDRFGPEIDEVWARTRGDYPVIVPRDATFLNWRFVDCPAPRYRCFVARRAGEAVGYVVLRRAEPEELPQGIIADIYAARRDVETLDALVRHTLGFFADTVCAVECGTSIAEFRDVLKAHGFFTSRSHHPTCVCRDEALRQRLTCLHDDWFLSKGDHDWDQIYPADPRLAAE